MINEKSAGVFTGAGVMSAIAASLCCITPVVALLAGSSSFAANFSWIEPFRPYLIGVSIAALGWAWFQKLRPKEPCDCEVERKPGFLQSTTFLVLVTAFASLMIAFPYYAKALYPKNEISDKKYFGNESVTKEVNICQENCNKQNKKENPNLGTVVKKECCQHN